MGRTTAITLSAEPDTALLVSAAALRRLGARITRYDTEDGTLEARPAPARAAVIRLRATAAGEHLTRLDLASEGAGARAFFRRFRTELSRPSPGRRQGS